jgi:hypothetical protein
MALPRFLTKATHARVIEPRGKKEYKKQVYLTIASSAQVFKTLTNSLECQVGTLLSAPLRGDETKVARG